MSESSIVINYKYFRDSAAHCTTASPYDRFSVRPLPRTDLLFIVCNMNARMLGKNIAVNSKGTIFLKKSYKTRLKTGIFYIMLNVLVKLVLNNIIRTLCFSHLTNLCHFKLSLQPFQSFIIMAAADLCYGTPVLRLGIIATHQKH